MNIKRCDNLLTSNPFMNINNSTPKKTLNIDISISDIEISKSFSD